MLNIKGFNTRLQEILNHYGFSASAFAEKIGIARSSISHIVSGRNKPSLEFVLNILENFEDVEFDWLMYGKGDFPKKEKKVNSTIESNAELNQTSLFKNSSVNENKSDLFLNTSNNTEIKNNKENRESDNIKEEIERVIIFYKNGSFKEYKN